MKQKAKNTILRRLTFPWIFQFFYRIRNIIHEQFQISFYFCDISHMHFKSIIVFYILLYHPICYYFNLIISLSFFGYLLHKNFSITFTKLHIYVDVRIGIFVRKKYNRLNMPWGHKKDVKLGLPLEAEYTF